MKLVRTFWQKILGVGSITIYCADKTESEFTLQSIARPESTRKLLGRAVEEERRARGIAGREMYGSSSEYMHHAMDGDLDGDGIAD
jgi:hypothetical protein